MTKTFTFKTNKANNGTIFSSNNKLNYEPNYSKIIDDIILADIKKKNDYLFETPTSKLYYSPIILNDSTLKDNKPSLANAIKFLANYKSYKKSYKLPYILGKMYTLSDGTPIVFYDDEIQIGFDTFKYSDFNNLSFLNGLTDNTKKIIINIYTNSAANININLL